MNSIDVTEENKKIINHVMESHGFEKLKKTQKDGFEDGILSSENHLLVAETGNGKTLCAEAIAMKHVKKDERVAYLVPSRQLVRDKKETIEDWAECKIESNKFTGTDITVATFESFYSVLLNNSHISFDRVILDDFHEIYSSFRGPEIEKAISLIRLRNIPIFAMSATIGNPEEISDWMNASVTISKEEREIQIEEETVKPSMNTKKESVAHFIKERKDESPFLVFNYAKSWTESRAKETSEKTSFESSENVDVRETMKKKIDGELTESLKELSELIDSGIAYHHSGLPTPVKKWIEELYSNGVIKCLFATTTIAYGFDAPVRTVVVADIKRGHKPVGVWEYQQWIGRAARPGFGYERGKAYTITGDEEFVRNKYFEPRKLEDVETHIKSHEKIRKIVLEFVSAGFDSLEDILRFMSHTLYWSDLHSQVGKSGASSMIENQVESEINWLKEKSFIESNRHKLRASRFGEATAEFLSQLFKDYSLSDIRTFYQWIGQEEIEEFKLVKEVTRLFGESISDGEPTIELENSMEVNTVGDDSITAEILLSYWGNNIPLDEIEERTGMDVSSLPTIAKRTSEILRASEVLLRAHPECRIPSWFDEIVEKIEYGVRRDEVQVVNSVQGVGRYRIRILSNGLSNSLSNANVELKDDDSVTTKLKKLKEKFL